LAALFVLLLNLDIGGTVRPVVEFRCGRHS